MFIVNIQSVRIEKVADPQYPDRQVLNLHYLDRPYSLVQVFAINQLETARNLWRHLTDDRRLVCLIVKDDRQYSVWVENIPQPLENDLPDPLLEPIFRAQLFLIDGLWAEVRELLGANQALAFGKEILLNIPTIHSIQDLLTTISVAMQSDRSIATYTPAEKQLLILHQEIHRLGGKYLGKNYTKELLGDLQQGLSPQLQQKLRNWLQKTNIAG